MPSRTLSSSSSSARPASNHRGLIDDAAARGSQYSCLDHQRRPGGWRSPSDAYTVDDDDDESDAEDTMDKKEEHWFEQVDDGFLLDGPPSHDVSISSPRGRPRLNSLGLSLSDLPPPSFSPPALSYPSPCTPSASTCGGSSYFPLNYSLSSAASKEASLPPSPALIPIRVALSSPPAPEEPASSPAPRVEPSLSHPLHRAKRLSMTPLSTHGTLPLSSPPACPPAKMQLRKGSIVELPELTALGGGQGETPLTPPLTPLGEAADLPSRGVEAEEKVELPRHGTALGEDRSKRFTKVDGKRQRQCR
ncbi:hypothetical protein JCM11251_007348 [Rhodosporidiobolus azoricus]